MSNDIYTNEITHQGSKFSSYVSKEFYERKRTKRLRKKLKVGEFLELGLLLNMTIIGRTDFEDDYDALFDDIFDFEHGKYNLGFMGASSSDNEIFNMSLVMEHDHTSVGFDEVVGEMLTLITRHFEIIEILDKRLIDINQ